MSTKISKETLLKWAQGLGADVQLAEADDENINLQDLTEKVELHAVDSRKAGIEQEIRKNARTEIAAEFGEMERKTVAKLFGITDKTVLQGKNLDKLLETAKEYHAKELNKNVEDWNREKTELSKMLTEKEEAWEAEKKTLEASWQAKYNERDVIEALRSHMEKVPRTGGDLQMQTKLFKAHIAERGIEPRYNAENKTIEFYKGNSVYVENGKTLKAEDLAKEFAKSGGFYAESTGHIAPKELQAGKERGEVSTMKDSPYAALKNAVGVA